MEAPILSKSMHDGTTRKCLNLELHAPQFRPEAFPWGSANVEIHAVFAAQQAYRRVLSLPCVMDLSALLFPGDKADCQSEAAKSLDVEIMGCDNGVTFTLGNASIPLPPTLQATSILSDHQFRVCITGEEGVRIGTLLGKIQARIPTSEDTGGGEAVGVRASQSYPGPADVREAENGMSADQVGAPRYWWYTLRNRSRSTCCCTTDLTA